MSCMSSVWRRLAVPAADAPAGAAVPARGLLAATKLICHLLVRALNEKRVKGVNRSAGAIEKPGSELRVHEHTYAQL